MLKVGIVGTGGISRSHIPAWMSMPETELVAACDIRPEMVDPVGENTGARVYYSLDDMLAKEKLDILDICLPTYLHADVAVRALNMGIHVLTEKPISLKFEDVDRVYAAAQKNQRCFMVAQVLRFWREYVYLKEVYETKRFGKLLSGNMWRLNNTPKWSWDGWMRDKNRSGLVPFDLHIHDLDFMIYTFGTPKDVVCNRARNEVQDYIHAVYQYDDFFIATEASWYDCTYDFSAGYRFQFEKAVIEFRAGVLTVYHQDNTREVIGEETVEREAQKDIPKSNAYFNEIRYFTDCVLANQPCQVVQPDELKTVLALIDRLDV